MPAKSLPPKKGVASMQLSEAEVVMAVVKDCPYHTCGYQTNIKGDLARHQKEKHPRAYQPAPR